VPQNCHGGDILVVGNRCIGGVCMRSLTRLDLTSGSEVWQANDFGDAAGSHGGWETIDVTLDLTAVLISGWSNRTYTTEMSYRSGGNTVGGQAVVMEIPVSALTSASAPTSASVSWKKVWSQHHVAHAARSLPSGEVAVLLYTETPDHLPVEAARGGAALTKLSASGSVVWGPINYASMNGTATQGMEGTDLQVSKDGTSLVMSGQGYMGDATYHGILVGKTINVAASNGAVNWKSEFASCGVPNECGTDLIKNECWGLQALSDGYVVSCGTGIENCNE
jgi:hypothetical protein